MTSTPGSVQRRLGRSAVAVASLLALAACSQPGSTPKASTTASLPTEMPAPYRTWARSTTVSACGFDPVRNGPEGNRNLSGWAVINAATGEVPEAFILQIEQGSTTYYIPTKPADRKDIATRLKNPSLIRSGFTATLQPKSIKPPFSATMLLAFQKKLFPCGYNTTVK